MTKAGSLFDREPLLPGIVMDELDPAAQPPKSQAPVWTFYGPGWRREAYRLHPGLVLQYERHLNRYRLFEDAGVLQEYLSAFRECVPSEETAEFRALSLSVRT
jgi:hypothetical protein